LLLLQEKKVGRGDIHEKDNRVVISLLLLIWSAANKRLGVGTFSTPVQRALPLSRWLSFFMVTY
jgi:hypothetical protein